MSGKFTHYLITRYNVPIPGFQMDKSGQSTRDEKWLQHRFALFEKFCLPSVLNQSNKEFNWLIYVDREAPVYYYDQLKTSVQNHPNIHIYQVSDHKECLQHVDQILSKSTTPYVITSRLDNDDAIGINFIQTVQDNFIEKDKVVINLLHGVGYDYIRNVVTLLYNMRNNHFTSLIEIKKMNGGHVTIRGFQHDEVPKTFTVINIPIKYSWLKLFHDRNVKSNVFGYPIFNSSLEEKFGLSNNTLTNTIPATISYSIWWLADGFKRKILRIRKR